MSLPDVFRAERDAWNRRADRFRRRGDRSRLAGWKRYFAWRESVCHDFAARAEGEARRHERGECFPA